MEPSHTDLASRYASMDEPELQAAARQRDQLTDDARDLLLAELWKRNVEPEPVSEADEEFIHDTEVWVTVERFRDLSSGIVARGALEAAGIPCFLRDENTVRLDWQISNFIGGMRLQVIESDLEAAREVLTGLVQGDETASDTGAPLSDELCPHCNSADIHRRHQRRSLALALLWLFSVPVSQDQAEWHCEQCGARWPEEAETSH